MTKTVNSILNQALELSDSEQASIVESLLSHLKSIDAKIDVIWGKEADARVEAYDKGEIEVVSAVEVFEKYNNL